MPEERSAKLSTLAVEVFSAVAALPAHSSPPSPAVLAEFAAWQGGKFTPDAVTCSIDSDGNDTLFDMLVYGWDLADSKWRAVGTLNNRQDFDITAVVGLEQLLSDVGIFGALTISAGSGAALKTVKFTPVSQVS